MPCSLDELRGAIASALAPSNFFVAPPGELRIEHIARESLPWEFFLGHLLDETQTRQTRTLESWHAWLDQPGGAAAERPLVSVHLDSATREAFVTRNIHVHGHAVTEQTPGVLETRPMQKWLREYVGRWTAVDDLRNASSALEEALATLLDKAYFGGSRLPVASHESPLPAMALGRTAWFAPCTDACLDAFRRNPRRQRETTHQCQTLADASGYEDSFPAPTAASPLRRAAELIDAAYCRRELRQQVRRIDLALRASTLEELPTIVERLWQRLIELTDPAAAAAPLIGAWFNQLALTPYQPLAGKLVVVMRALSRADRLGPEQVSDVLCRLLRSLAWHLTAFDLKTFHNFGADYPDLLLLDDLLKLLLELSQTCVEPYAAREPLAARRRAALLQAVLVRQRYRGLPVPDAPTSPGDNQRVWPAEIPRTSDEAIFNVSRRTKSLFTGDDLNLRGPDAAVFRGALAQAAAELESDQADLLRELGFALFLDRPLGAAKSPGEIDRTPLLSYVAYSPTIAVRRLAELHAQGWLDAEQRRALTRRTWSLQVPGYALEVFHGRPRPGVATLADAPLVSPDFVFLRTTRSSLDNFLAGFDRSELRAADPQAADWLESAPQVLLIRTSAWPPAREKLPFMTAFDETMTPRVAVFLSHAVDDSLVYEERSGREYPRGARLAPLPLAAAGRHL